MKLDVKSTVIGLLLGVTVMLAVGAGGRDSGSGIGFAVPTGGKAILKGSNGEAFLVDVSTGMADRILFKKPEPGEPRYPNNINGHVLTLAD